MDYDDDNPSTYDPNLERIIAATKHKARTAALREAAEWLRTAIPSLPNSGDYWAACMLGDLGVELTPQEETDRVPF